MFLSPIAGCDVDEEVFQMDAAGGEIQFFAVRNGEGYQSLIVG